MNKLQFGNKDTIWIGKGTTERILWCGHYPPLKARNMLLVGHSVIRNGQFDIRRPDPEVSHVLVVLRGEGRGWSEGKWHKLQEGSAFLTGEHHPHAYQSTGAWEFVWCLFDKGAFPDFRGAPVIKKTNPTLWSHLVLGLLEEASRQSESPQLERWTEILRHESQQLLTQDEDYLLSRLWSHVMANLHVKWTLATLAQKAGMNPETLRQQCQREQGTSPIIYLTRLRMQHAAGLLESGQKVEYVARMVGYENPFAFSVAFRRTMGQSPIRLKLRKQNKLHPV